MVSTDRSQFLAATTSTMAAVILEIVAISLCISSICGFVVSRQQTSTIGSALRGVTHSEAVVRTTPVKNLYDGMKIRRLPHSNLEVSEVCLGTLNFGDQLDEAQSTAILDSAFGEYGINFLVRYCRRYVIFSNFIV